MPKKNPRSNPYLDLFGRAQLRQLQKDYAQDTDAAFDPHLADPVSNGKRGSFFAFIEWLRFHLPRPNPLVLGVVSTMLLALASFGSGATRNRGGVLEALGLEFLSFGHGAAILNFFFALGLIGLVFAWAVLGRREIIAASDNPGRLRRVQSNLVWWTVPLLFAAPMMSRDVYSYLMQGAMVRDGFDPYTEGAAVNPGPYLLEVSHDWRNTTTPYGPLHLWIGEGVTTVVGDNVAAGIIFYKVISVIGFLGIAWAIPRIASKLGGDPALALWLGVANPVMILHMVGGMHNESVMAALVSIGLLACLHRKFVIGVILISIAVSLKATAAIALPFVVWMATYHYAQPHPTKGRFTVSFLSTGAIGVALTLATVAVVTWLSGSSWGWLSEITGNSKVINPLALPTLATEVTVPFLQLFNPDFDYNVALNFYRTLFPLLMLAGLVAIWWYFRGGDRRSIMGTTAAYQWAFVANSVTLPWYYASVITLLGTFNPPLWLVRLSTGASIFVALAFTGSGNHQLYNIWWVGPTALIAWGLTAYVVPLHTRRREDGFIEPLPEHA